MSKVRAYRIKNFRSIADTGWCPLAQDGVTVLVGQNESGKTSALEALARTLSSVHEVTGDDIRVGADLPEIELKLEITSPQLNDFLNDTKIARLWATKIVDLSNYLENNRNLIDIKFNWTRSGETFKKTISLSDSGLAQILEATSEDSDEISEALTDDDYRPTDIANLLYDEAPNTILFNADSGLLPDQIDINEKFSILGQGALAARNFLSIANINLKNLVLSDRRARQNVLDRANSKVSTDFVSFWSQTIGNNTKLSIECDLEFHAADSPKSGTPYLVFWIKDGLTKLYPRQRSQGVRWFISFYLQVHASEKIGYNRIFLLDEPGANLHAKAQGDVLKLINHLSKNNLPFIYSTHSPHLVENEKLYRVHAVQRDDLQEDSPTIIIDAHRLAAASSDTLSPILTAMGADFSSHASIPKNNNVLVEEISGFYYLNAFWKLSARTKSVYFLAATGVNKLESLSYMFLGWGLSHLVVLDDDRQGREVYKNLKKTLYNDDDNQAKNNLIKINDCGGIEDVFSKPDFSNFVLNEKIASRSESNSDYVKQTRRSKPVLAFQFKLRVDNGDLKLSDFDKETAEKITALTSKIEQRLI
ncbi:ATP-dependent nuclease [Nevskia ramosa]|uniref:ATP-dependent nuclease n=1 Tax=Nevskia ramosa TaxID=64002 RepID=UPI0004070383|nr:AAA family ATPase [Nevskia ramosa]